MNLFKWPVGVALSIALVACGGGGGGAGTSVFGGGSSGTTPTASAASIVLDLGGAATISNNGSDTVTATVTATSANNVVLANVPVTFSASSGVLAVQAGVTDAQGKVSATVSIGADKANRSIQVTATSGSLVQAKSFLITGSKVRSTLVPSVASPNTTAEVQYQVVDVNGNPMPEQTITVNSTAKSSTGLTDSNGVYAYAYTSPSTPGDLVITAISAGVTQVDHVTVQAASGSTKQDVTLGSILSASVDVSPGVVVVNDVGSTVNRAAVRALFVGANNAAVPNVRVRFDLANDPNTVGGAFSSGSSIVYSAANGEATTFYIPSTKFSPTNGVTVRACYGYTDADLANNSCPNFTIKTLTVASGAFSVSIGTNNKFIELNNGLQLAQDFVVTVNDSAGRAKSDVEVVPSIDLISFGKGFWTYNGTKWILNRRQYFTDGTGASVPEVDPNNLASATGGCWNEDRNRSGTLESVEDDSTIAYGPLQGGNGNGVLDPSKADVLVTIGGLSTAKTDASGSVVVRITYARNLAGWIKYNVLVSASGISGTEGRANWQDVLAVPLLDINSEAVPAFANSRYGISAGCQNSN